MEQISIYGSDLLIRIASGSNPFHLYIRMNRKNPKNFSPRITGCSYNTSTNHILSVLS